MKFCRNPLKRCAKCGLPETYETIEFDKKDVCNICNQKVYKDNEINWNSRKITFDKIIGENRDKHEYDCIVPFSGGKDSTFTLYYLVKEYNLKPLVVQFNHGFMRPKVLENNLKTFKKLGVDVLSFTPNWNIVKRVMKESLIRKGDFCWHCHTGIFAYPMQIAVKYQTPLVIWGEPSSEYTAYFDYRDNEIELVDETRFNRFVNLGINSDDMFGMISEDTSFDKRDLAPFSFPELRDLKKLKVRSVCLGSFIPWDVKKNVRLIEKELDWKGDEVEGMPWEENLYNYEKIECYLQGVRDYIKYLKRGYSRVSQMTALDVRNNRIDKALANELIQKYEGYKPHSLDIFLRYLEISETEFNNIVLNTVVSPHEPDIEKIELSPKTWDYESWYRE